METAAPTHGVLDGRWQLGEVIGRGAAADVHAATDLTNGTSVAVKVIRAVDADAARRFQREVAALEGVDHGSIVAVLGHGTCDDGRPYVVLERVQGGTLHDVLQAGPIGPTDAASLGAGLAGALAHAHERGVVHRDVKPANVLLDGDGQPKLADFGIARLVDAGTLTATGLALGTPAYLAPEQVRGERVGPPADVYALGLVVLEAATGERAFPGDGVAAALARLEHPVPIPPSLPSPLASALAAMTAADPADRPTAAEASSRLAAVDDAGATAAMPVAGMATTAMAVPPDVPVPAKVAAPVAPVAPLGARRVWLALPPRARHAAVALACFVAGFLAVLLVRDALAGDDGPRPDAIVETTTTTTTPPTTTTTTAPPDEEEDREEGEGRGNGNGNGNGRGDRDD